VPLLLDGCPFRHRPRPSESVQIKYAHCSLVQCTVVARPGRSDGPTGHCSNSLGVASRCPVSNPAVQRWTAEILTRRRARMGRAYSVLLLPFLYYNINNILALTWPPKHNLVRFSTYKLLEICYFIKLHFGTQYASFLNIQTNVF
jgi:hypothetical protein